MRSLPESRSVTRAFPPGKKANDQGTSRSVARVLTPTRSTEVPLEPPASSVFFLPPVSIDLCRCRHPGLRRSRRTPRTGERAGRPTRSCQTSSPSWQILACPRPLYCYFDGDYIARSGIHPLARERILDPSGDQEVIAALPYSLRPWSRIVGTGFILATRKRIRGKREHRKTTGAGSVRSHLDALRPMLGIVFLAGYAWQISSAGSWVQISSWGWGGVCLVNWGCVEGRGSAA